MMMIVDISGTSDKFENITSGLESLASEIGVDIRLQNEDIFNCMHRI